MKKYLLILIMSLAVFLSIFIQKDLLLTKVTLTIYFIYLMITDFKKQEVEYPDIFILFIISGYFAILSGKYFFIGFVIIVIIWTVVEFIIFRKSEKLIMMIGIVDFFYIVIFFAIFLRNSVVLIDNSTFYILQILGIFISIIFYLIYKKKYPDKILIPYLYIMFPLTFINLFLYS